VKINKLKEISKLNFYQLNNFLLLFNNNIL